MSRKVIHEHKIPKSVTVALYAIAIALTLNLAKPFIGVSPASAELTTYDLQTIEKYLSYNMDYLSVIARNTDALNYM